MDARFASALTPAAPGGVGLLREEGQLRAAAALLAVHFDDKIRGDIEAAALRGTLDGQLLSIEVVVAGVLDASGAVQAASLCVHRYLPQWGRQVLEIVWFAAHQRGQGHGGRLFDYLLLAARSNCVDAILSSSTNKAMPFWLSRPGVRIAEVVIRAGRMEKPAIPPPFCLLSQPRGYVMERFYLNVLRNRKGKVIGSFEGRPYYYGAVTSNHVWYVLNPKLAIKTVTLQRVHKPATRAEADPASAAPPTSAPGLPCALGSPIVLVREASSFETLDSPSSAGSSSSFSPRGSRSPSEASEASEASDPSPSREVSQLGGVGSSDREPGPSASAASAICSSASHGTASASSLPLPALLAPVGARVPATA
jgi:hypothetical protein